MTKKAIVKRAVRMQNPPEIPIRFFNRDKEKSYIQETGYAAPHNFHPADPRQTEWGFHWERLDNTMGQPKGCPLADLDLLDQFIPPDPNAEGRFDHVDHFIRQNANAYLLGNVGISGFNFVTFLHGFENTLEDLYLDRDRICQLIDLVLEFETGIIRRYGEYAFDAIGFGDDWGTQNALMIAPDLWREVFKPRFKKQFDLVHSYGKDVYYHSCGQIWDIIPDLIEIGVDILNLNQPDIFGIERLGTAFSGKVCFNCPVDHQTVAIHGDRGEIFEYVRRLNANLGNHGGGFIGYIEEYSSVGMSEANYQAIVEAFEGLNR